MHILYDAPRSTLRPTEVKIIIWCIFQREHIVESCCDLQVLSASKDF